MYVGKPFRVLLYGAIAGAVAALIFCALVPRIGLWAAVLAVISVPISWFVGGLLVDGFDSWLRRVTRDPRARQ